MLRRLLPILLGVLIVAGGLYGLAAVFSGRDTAGIGSTEHIKGPGRLEPAGGAQPGAPPTSGAHATRQPTRQGRVSRDELLTALASGDVAIAYPGPGKAPASLTALQELVSGPFDPKLAAAGQMVLLVRWPGIKQVQALAWRRRLQATGPQDPRLRAFADAWLGKGQGGTS